MNHPSDPYVIVLAGGEGNRLAPLTRALYGEHLPKQFAVIAGQRSLLQTTVERALGLTTADRISVVVTTHHERRAREQLAPYPGVELVVQPANLDTAPGMLLPLVRILARDPEARIVFLPSDHHVANVEPIHQALGAAASGPLRDRIALVGVDPTGPEVEYGWIVRGSWISSSAAFEVARFREKPSAAEAVELWQDGGLWNTFILTGPARAFWDAAAFCLPGHAVALESYAAEIGGRAEAAALQASYRVMPAANFSRDVLSQAGGLAVLPVADSGWSDWGSPARVFASLAGTDDCNHLLRRIGGDAAAIE